jgi:hypothetical protein
MRRVQRTLRWNIFPRWRFACITIQMSPLRVCRRRFTLEVGVSQVAAEQGSQQSEPRPTRIVALAAIWAIVLAVLVVWGLVANASAKPDTAGCKQPGAVPVPLTAPSKPAQLKPRAEPVTAVPFSRNRTIERRLVEYDVTDPGKVLAKVSQLAVFTGQFISSDGSQQLNPGDINATAVLQSGRVILTVCFNRTDPSFGAPGSYLGTVSIVDPRVNRTDVAFNITMSYPCWQFVFALFVAMLLPAILYVWFLKGSFQSNKQLTIGQLQNWIFCRTALMAIGAGIAAAIGVFSAIYAKAPAWGTDWTSATGLFGATFSAFVAAATAVIAAGSDKQSPKVAIGNQEEPAAESDKKSPNAANGNPDAPAANGHNE